MKARLALLALATLTGPLVALAGLSAPASAQDACRRYRAQLAELDRGGGEARQVGREAAQLTGYYRSIGCEGGGFFLFDTRPAQCGAIAQRIRALAETESVVTDTRARRRQLVAAIAQACEPRGGEAGERTARGGGNLVCVRACDGGFFPMDNVPDGRGGADAMCQALCPGTEAAAYAMPSGDDALAQAAAVRTGRAYTALPNAFKFRTSFVENCTCRRPNETWAQSLAKAEAMLDRHKGDVIVTAARAEQMSRPKLSAAALAQLKLVPVGVPAVSTARPITSATASLAARQTGATSVGAAPVAAEAPDLDAKVETTGSLSGAGPVKDVRVIPNPGRPTR